MSADYPQELLERAAKIRLLLLDVDGVLTDGTLLYSGAEVESKAFNTQDGFGLTLLREAGIGCGVITARRSEVVARRTAELKMGFVRQGARDKVSAFEEILQHSDFAAEEVAYMGDDWLDLPLLGRVGLAAAPANADPELHSRVHFVTARSGGHGAVRDLCTLLLNAKGVLDHLLSRYLD